jgi:TRAP-type C4-dicarboxylate transport system permease large subunit
VPSLVPPCLIRSTVGATATEVSTIAVLHTLFVGHQLYGGISARNFYGMLFKKRRP